VAYLFVKHYESFKNQAFMGWGHDTIIASLLTVAMMLVVDVVGSVVKWEWKVRAMERGMGICKRYFGESNIIYINCQSPQFDALKAIEGVKKDCSSYFRLTTFFVLTYDHSPKFYDQG
jgi:hypothetical protein